MVEEGGGRGGGGHVFGTYFPKKKSHASWLFPSARLLMKYRLTDLHPSCSSPRLVRLPVRVKSVFNAPVPEYSRLMTLA